jgi:hypothetical protein
MLTSVRSSLCSQECEHGTHECVRYMMLPCASSSFVAPSRIILAEARGYLARNAVADEIVREQARRIGTTVLSKAFILRA